MLGFGLSVNLAAFVLYFCCFSVFVALGRTNSVLSSVFGAPKPKKEHRCVSNADAKPNTGTDAALCVLRSFLFFGPLSTVAILGTCRTLGVQRPPKTHIKNKHIFRFSGCTNAAHVNPNTTMHTRSHPLQAEGTCTC